MTKKGFTLIELLIVITVIGIVAAIAIPNFLMALQKGKQKVTMGDMKSIGTAIESYITDMYMAPGGGGVTLISGLENYLNSFYTKALPFKDGWGCEFQYTSGPVGPTQDVYSVISYGRGSVAGVINTANNGYFVQTIADFEIDICYSNGNFTYGPKVK